MWRGTQAANVSCNREFDWELAGDLTGNWLVF